MEVLCFKFNQNRTVNEVIDFFEGEGDSKKMKTCKMSSQNKSMYEVPSKSDNGKGFTNRGKIRECNKPTEKPRYVHPKMAKLKSYFFLRGISTRGLK